ncbi:MAG: PadR family transcriptional regulator PadR [Pseudohongiellaceae bacterium]|jgi:PadR family transcriptional regulator PadR
MKKNENDAKKSRNKDDKSTNPGAAEPENPKVSPTGDMLTAHLLGMLNGWSAYGYELAQRLEEAGLGSYNKGSIYRNLRQMEDSGLVSSSWDTSKDGPARRIYDLTDTGSLFLKNWMTMAEMHRNFLRTMMEMNPLIPSMSSSSRNSRTDSNKKDNNESEES